MKKLILLLFIPLVSFGQSSFCNGWTAGYQKGLESCMKMGVTPVCPIPKMLADTYGDGYGLGYKKAKEKCNDKDSSSSSGAYENPQLGITDYTSFSKGVNDGMQQTMNMMNIANSNRNNVNIDYVKKLSYINKNWIVDRKWTLERGVEYQVIVDRFIDAENNTIYVDLAKMSLTTVDMIVQHKDTRTRFIFRNFKTGENNKITNYGGGIRSYDWFMIKKGKWRGWMKKYGKKNIADYLENSISKSDDDDW